MLRIDLFPPLCYTKPKAVIFIKPNDKIVDFRINPYIQEATLQIALDIIVLVIVTAVLILASFPIIAWIAVDIAYFVIALIFHYRVVILALIDKQKCDYITEKISIKQFKEEYSFAGDRLGHSNIRFFYPKEMQVQRYKVKVISGSGEENKLRTVMSLSRMLKFAILDKQQIEYLNVTYLKRSKVIVAFDLAQDIESIASKRTKDKIKKSIHCINTSI